MTKRSLFAPLLLALACAPLAAGAANRDSDGDVTSVIRPVIVIDGKPVIYYRFDTPGTPLEFAVTATGPVAEFTTAPVPAGATVQSGGGETYRVESADGAVFLRHASTGAIIPGTPLRRVERNGRVLTANPKGFGID